MDPVAAIAVGPPGRVAVREAHRVPGVEALVTALTPYHSTVLPVQDHWRHVYAFTSDSEGNYTIESHGKDGVDGADIGDPAVLLSLAPDAGLDPDSIDTATEVLRALETALSGTPGSRPHAPHSSTRGDR